MTTHIVKGRSIDGTVYRTGQGWTNEYWLADRFTHVEALAVIEHQKSVNRLADADDCVGKLDAIVFDPARYERDKKESESEMVPYSQQWAETYGDNLGESPDY